MKKLMVLATVAAMALGAKADWSVVAKNDDELSSNDIIAGGAISFNGVDGSDNYTIAYILTANDYTTWLDAGAKFSELAHAACAKDTSTMKMDSVQTWLAYQGVSDTRTMEGNRHSDWNANSGTPSPLQIIVTTAADQVDYFTTELYSLEEGVAAFFRATGLMGDSFVESDRRLFGTVPEPTSGLLLLFGLAGLALKRKHA